MLDLVRAHHWVAVNSYRVRVAAFVLLGIPIALHMFPRSPGELFWAGFLLQFVVYPHLLQWRTRRSAQPEKAELDNLIVDAVMSGAWAAGLGFPLWITVAFVLAALLNHTIMRGLPGILICPVAFLGGALASTTVIAFRLSTDTDGLVTLASIVGLAIYLSLMGVEFFTYIRRLHEVQGAVAAQKQVLEDANVALHDQISKIHDLQEKLREQANRDSLTGLFNRRYLEGTLERELARCKREGAPLTMLLFDIDYFKAVNDTYGHQAGDEVLRVFGRPAAGKGAHRGYRLPLWRRRVPDGHAQDAAGYCPRARRISAEAIRGDDGLIWRDAHPGYHLNWHRCGAGAFRFRRGAGALRR